MLNTTCLKSYKPNGKNRQKKQSEGVRYCQKYTPTDCFFGDFCLLGRQKERWCIQELCGMYFFCQSVFSHHGL